MSDKVLSLEEFNAIDTKEPSVSNKKVLSIEDFNRLGVVEESIQQGTPDEAELENNVFKTMAKGTADFFSNIKESYDIGNDSSNIDMMGYSALNGELNYNDDVKPIREAFNKRLKDKPDGDNILSDAIYSVAGMIPAMAKGTIKGKVTGLATATGVSLIPGGAAAAPTAFALGDVVGSMDYWYKQGAGSLYSDLKEEDIDDGIAAPVAHIAGALYGAVEYSQVDKIFPGTKLILRKAITEGIKKTVSKLVIRYGVNWAEEVGEEGLQEIIMSMSKDIGTNIGQKTNLAVGTIVEKALNSGWNAAKESALPMLLMLGPRTALETKEFMDDQKAIKQADDILSVMDDGEPLPTPKVEAEPKTIEQETTKAVVEALDEPLPVEESFIEDDTQIEEPSEDLPITPEVSDYAAPDAVQGVEENLQRISETDEYIKYGERIAELQSQIDAFAAKKEASKEQNIKIRKFKGGYLKEELESIPKKYFSSDPNAMTLDELADQWNVSTNEAIEILKSNVITKKDISDIAAAKQEIKEIESIMKQENPQIGEAVASITQKTPKLKLTQAQLIKRLYQARFKGEREGFKEGKEKGKQEVKSAKEILERRKNRIKGIALALDLSDQDMKKVTKRDIRLMSNLEFKEFIDKLESFATTYAEKREAKNRVMFEIQDKRLQKVDNLVKALELPPINKMTLAQLNKLEEYLSQTEADDEFLSVRKLQTVKNTELAGILTYREARQKLAEKLGVGVKDLESVQFHFLDKFKGDYSLAERNPFYRLLVDETMASTLDADKKFYDLEKEVDDLVKKARQSKDKTLSEKLIPTDKIVFGWLEANEAGKKKLSEKMTPEEIDLANYLRQKFEQYREYLIKNEILKKYKVDYVTHVRRGTLEAWKEDGVITAFKELADKYKEDEQTFTILEGDTGNILPMEKFLPYALHRTGNLKPSQNVAKAFKTYSKAILRKQALDHIIPALDIYAYSLSPKGVTPRGLQMDRRLVGFVREWLNNKKGRKSSLAGLIPQGGKIDLTLKYIDSFITMLDLGLNIPVSMTISVGEQVTSFTNLGSKKYTTGIKRLFSEKGRKIIQDNIAFIGKSPWRELSNTADTVGDKFSKAMFSMFELSNTNANKIHLLGSLTDKEWEDGQISTERLAELKRDVARWRAVPGTKSIFGSTSPGSAYTKYKSWAIPIARTVIKDLATIGKMIKNGDIKTVTGTREFQELFRATMVSSLLFLAGKAIVDDEDRTFMGEILRKAYRETLSLLGALDPTMFTKVRMRDFLGDLAESIKMIIKLEEYADKPGYKGVEKLKRTMTPKAIKQFSSGSQSGRIG